MVLIQDFSIYFRFINKRSLNILHFIVISYILFTIHHNLMNELSSLLCKIDLWNFTLIWLCMQSFLILTIHYAMQNNFEILTLSLLNKMVILYVFAATFCVFPKMKSKTLFCVVLCQLVVLTWLTPAQGKGLLSNLMKQAETLRHGLDLA